MFKTIEECDVELIAFTSDVGGNDLDYMPVRAARVSFNNDDTAGQDVARDDKLMRYLADHQHMTPFEYQHATMMIECPLFIRSQIHRHRTFSYNEISRRYTSEDLEFWMPSSLRAQSKSNRQASDGLVQDQELAEADFVRSVATAMQAYSNLLELGVAREQARAVLPQSLLTRFYMGGNLRNWAHFLQLRLDSHAQHEVQVVAQKVEEQLNAIWPKSMAALMPAK